MESIAIQETDITLVLIMSISMVIVLCCVVILFFYFSRSKVLKEQLATKNLKIKHQTQLVHESILTQEEERKRIAQDLHDDISAKLNVINLNLHLLKDRKLSPDDFSDITETIAQVTTQALSSSRKIAHDLLPPILDKFGIIPAIDELCDGFNSSKKVVISHDIDDMLESLSKPSKLQLFRVFQELINNSMRHGKATQITIAIETNEANFKINYTDNGKGFNTANIENMKGLGMKNIMSRVELLKGAIDFKSEIGQGVQVKIEI